MKKYITIAALLAAGTAFSNAITLDDAVLSLVGDQVVSAPTVSGSGDFTITFTLNEAGVQDLVGMIGESGAASLTSNYVSMAIADASHIFGVSSGYSTKRLDTGVSDGIVHSTGIYISGNTAGTGHNSTGPAYKNSTGMSPDALTLDNISNIAVTLSYDAGTQCYLAVTAFYADGSSITSFGNGGNWHWSSDSAGAWQSFAVNTEFVESVYVMSGSANTSDALAALNTAAISAIPEPSAFGLLAGVGALALVAARRRRTK